MAEEHQARSGWCLTAMVLAGMLVVGHLLDWNQQVFWVLNRLPWPALWSNLTELGDGLILGVLLFPLLRRNPRILTAYLLGIAVNTLVVQGLKSYLAFPRPAGVLDPETFRVLGPVLTARAFPSGHSATIFLLAGMVGYWYRGAIRWGMVILASVVAVSRVSVGAHWPQDILAGAFIGWVVGCAVAVWVEKRYWYPRHPGGLAALGGLYFLAGVVAIVAYPRQYPWAMVTHTLLPLVAWGWGTWQWWRLVVIWWQQRRTSVQE